MSLAASTAASYAATWELFTDWCAVSDRAALPASPENVVQFLHECPASTATHRRRVAVIDHHLVAAGYPPVGADPGVRRATGRPVRSSLEHGDVAVDVRDALRRLLSHGWTQGLFGRRDRCLLVLARIAGLTYRQLAALTPDDIRVSAGATEVASAGRTRALLMGDDPVLCAPCAVLRWLQTHRVIVELIATAAVADDLAYADPITPQSPHVCMRPPAGQLTQPVPLFAPIDQWGHTPFPLFRLTPHALSRRTRDMMAGAIAVHRTLPTRVVAHADVTVAAPEPEHPARYSRSQWWTGVQQRRQATERLAETTDQLVVVDEQADALQRRIAELLTWATSP